MNNKRLNKEDLLDILECLNTMLRENQLTLELTIYGGSIMKLIYDNRPATRDIDCIINTNNEVLVNNILNDIGDIYGLPKDWINDDIKDPLKVLIQENKEIFKVYSNLKIIAPCKEQLLAMKVLSARNYPSNDFSDAERLVLDLGITTKKELMTIIRKYIPIKYLGERQLMFIKYIGQELGYEWE